MFILMKNIFRRILRVEKVGEQREAAVPRLRPPGQNEGGCQEHGRLSGEPQPMHQGELLERGRRLAGSQASLHGRPLLHVEGFREQRRLQLHDHYKVGY